MNLRNWTSNSWAVLNSIPKFHRESQEIISVLGIQWNTNTDTLSVKSMPFEGDITPQNVLKQSAQFYDLCGWFTPITIRSKLLLQQLHELQLTWGQLLPENLALEWKNIQTNLRQAASHQIQRYLQNLESPSSQLQLHTFADALRAAHACVTYLHIQEENTENRIIICKSLCSTDCTSNQT